MLRLFSILLNYTVLKLVPMVSLGLMTNRKHLCYLVVSAKGDFFGQTHRDQTTAVDSWAEKQSDNNLTMNTTHFNYQHEKHYKNTD